MASDRVRHVGAVLIVSEPFKVRTTEEVACWFTEIEIEPGEYVVRAPGPLHYFRSAAVPGTITDEHYPSLFGGVSYGEGPDAKRNVGKPRTYFFPLPESCEADEGYGADQRERFNRSDRPVRIELRPELRDPDVSVVGIDHEPGTGGYGVDVDGEIVFRGTFRECCEHGKELAPWKYRDERR